MTDPTPSREAQGSVPSDGAIYSAHSKRLAMKGDIVDFIHQELMIISGRKVSTERARLLWSDLSEMIATPPPATPSSGAVTIDLTEREQYALSRLMAEHELSDVQIFRQALRSYQRDYERLKAGETVAWSGDEQRMRDFAGPLTSSPASNEIPEFFYPITDDHPSKLEGEHVWLWHHLWDHARMGWYDNDNKWWKIGFPEGPWWGCGIFPSHLARVCPREYYGREREVTIAPTDYAAFAARREREAREPLPEAITPSSGDACADPKLEDQEDLKRMAELFDNSADGFESRLGKDNIIAKQERRSASLFRLAAGALDLHWAAQEVFPQGVASVQTPSSGDAGMRDGELEKFRAALVKISAIRDGIVGMQGFNFSEHAYPLVAALDEAGFEGAGYEISLKNLGTLIEQIKAAEAEIERLNATPSREIELRAALEPFAAFCPDADSLPDNWKITPGSSMAARQLTVGDLRRARSALHPSDGGEVS